MDEIFAALHSVPDYSAGHPPLVGVSHSLQGAIDLLYPGQNLTLAQFRESTVRPGCWNGPDGYGEVRRLEIMP